MPAATHPADPAARPLPAELTVIIPCFNEAANVAPMVERLEAALRGVAWEAVFVDDNSPDGTAERVREIAARDPRVRALRRVGRRGLASAVTEGALSSSAPLIAVIDGDLQHDETILPAMLEAVRGGAEVAVGSRHAEGGEAATGFSAGRARVSGLGARLSAMLLPTPVGDPMSGFFLMRRELFEAILPRLSNRGFKILVDLLLSAGRPLRVAEVPYRFRPRLAGESKLDATVLLEFLGLLMDKSLGGWLPWRFVAFAGVGAVGILVHLAVLGLLSGIPGIGFAAAQWTATFVAMTVNFLLNNRITYRDLRLRGARLARGLLLFYLGCGIGAAANVGVAGLLLQEGVAGWGLAGAAGALLTVVWNYAISSTLVWRSR
ncbi:glycosyltransferase family 2 protein [Muricoccus pecuniae]|uniref:Dolichol-phosphate mannosyltransferase n=1 Tax=Muricoccus pecuniae TaxID=693023 RepID=A0A840YMA5_9PROT|nr:glycosyltransferase family 2 protein [Roseomonas pecuniae]MBB5696103.1 dolichol-phosphate mannosyltransferase [Roseomonas pecuniae]